MSSQTIFNFIVTVIFGVLGFQEVYFDESGWPFFIAGSLFLTAALGSLYFDRTMGYDE